MGDDIRRTYESSITRPLRGNTVGNVAVYERPGCHLRGKYAPSAALVRPSSARFQRSTSLLRYAVNRQDVERRIFLADFVGRDVVR
jgi:hypothetical protein